MEVVGGRRSQSLWVVRHGESTWNAAGRMQRQIAHPPLTARGIAQAYAAGYTLRDKRIDHIICSDAVRASQTAQAISTIAGLPVTPDPRLRERGWAAGIRSASPGRPTPERLEDPTPRIREVLLEIAESDRRTVVVTHGDIVLTIIGLLRPHKTGRDNTIGAWTTGTAVPNGAVLELALGGFRASVKRR